MHLINLFLPLYDNAGNSTPREHFDAVRKELTDRFGGLTAYNRAPVEGLWKEGSDTPQRDDLVIFEVLADDLNTHWWREYRQSLERLFKQEQILIRAHPIEVL